MNSRLFALSTFFSFLKYLWTHYQFRDLTMIYLSFERNNYEFTIFLANLFWNYYVSREFTMNSSSVREFTMSSIFVSWFDYKFIFFSQTHSQFSFFPEFTIFLANSQWIHYFFCDFTMKLHLFRFLRMNPLSISWFDYQRIIRSLYYYGFTCYNSIWLWINERFRRIYDEFAIFSRIHYELTIFFANPL